MFALVVVALTLTGFVAASQLELEPVWAALAGAVLLGVHNLKRRDNTASGIARSVHLPFLVPNLTDVGSLANLLWRRILGGHRLPTNAAEFSFLGTSDGPIVHGARGAGVWAGIETFGT